MSDNSAQFGDLLNDGDISLKNQEPASSQEKQRVSRPIFLTPALVKLLEALVRSINDSRFLTIVKGQQGSGKSILRDLLVEQIRMEYSLCTIDASHVIGERHIIDILNLTYFPDKHYEIDELVDHLSHMGHTGIAILIDDAHNLSSFALNVLISLQLEIKRRGGVIGIILFAQPMIDRILASPSIKQQGDVFRIIDMPSLSVEQIHEYITDLINNSGQPDQLTSSQIQSIARHSQGRPGIIDHLVKRTMSRPESKQGQDTKAVNNYRLSKPIALVSLLIFFSVVAIYWQGLDNDAAELSSDSNNDVDHSQPIVASLLETNSSLQVKPTHDANLAQSKIQLKPRAAVIADVNMDQTQNSLVPGAPKTTNKMPVVKQSVVSVTKPISMPEAESKDKQLPAKKINEQDNKRHETILPVIKAKASAVSKPAVRASKPLIEQAWLLEQDGSYYTIQLAASSSSDAIQRFIKQQPALKDLHYVRSMQRGQGWYLSLYGAFETFSAAKSAEAALPASMTKNDPWIRRLSKIQSTITDLPKKNDSNVIVKQKVVSNDKAGNVTNKITDAENTVINTDVSSVVAPGSVLSAVDNAEIEMVVTEPPGTDTEGAISSDGIIVTNPTDSAKATILISDQPDKLNDELLLPNKENSLLLPPVLP